MKVFKTSDDLIAWLGDEIGDELQFKAENLQLLNGDDMKAAQDAAAEKLEGYRIRLHEFIDAQKRAVERKATQAQVDVGAQTSRSD